MTHEPPQNQPYDPNGRPQNQPADPTSVGSHYELDPDHYQSPGYGPPGPQQSYGPSGAYQSPSYQQPYMPPGYQTHPAGYPTPGAPPGRPQEPQGMAIASLVLGVCSLAVTFCCWGGGVLPAILAMIFGGIAISKANKGDGGGRGLALGGFITGTVSLVLSVVVIIGIVFLGMQDPTLYN